MKKKRHNQGYLLGVDTGNSKTHALITTISGSVVGFGEAGCGNYEVVGLDGLIKAMKQAADEAFSMAQVVNEDVVGMGFGLSGYDWPSEKTAMATAIEALGIPGEYDFVNDVEIGLIAGSSEGWGVAVDAGTGNNVRGYDKLGRMGRITGNSAHFGEFGGGGELVWRAVVSVTYAWTQRGPKTRLTQMMIDYADVDSEFELIEGLAMNKIQLPPTIAEEVFRLAKEGDQIAYNVVNFSARELALNVNAVIRQLNLQSTAFEVVLIGSIFKAGDIFLGPFTKIVLDFSPEANIVHLSTAPVVGAILLGAEKIGIVNNEFRNLLVKSAKAKLSSLSNFHYFPT